MGSNLLEWIRNEIQETKEIWYISVRGLFGSILLFPVVLVRYGKLENFRRNHQQETTDEHMKQFHKATPSMGQWEQERAWLGYHTEESNMKRERKLTCKSSIIVGVEYLEVIIGVEFFVRTALKAVCPFHWIFWNITSIAVKMTASENNEKIWPVRNGSTMREDPGMEREKNDEQDKTTTATKLTFAKRI